ncbi:hypothetical protein V8D89_014358 [Ganoderma adspersum]
MSDSEPRFRSPWVATDDRKKEVEPREREVFARAQEEMESKADTEPKWTTRDLVVLIRASRSDRLASRATKKFAKAKLAALWSWDLFSVTPAPRNSSGAAIDALMTARYGRLPQVSKRALYELMRGQPDLSALYDLRHDPPTDFFLSDRQFFRLFLAREVLLGEWRAFVTVRPAVLKGPCPSASESTSGTPAPAGGAADRCSAARRRCARDWGETVGEEMLSEEHRYDPICALDVLRETVTDWAEDGICGGCVERLRETCEQKKTELWKTVGNWLAHAEYDNEDEEAMEEITPWSRVWPEWDSGDEVPVVQEKKGKVEEDDNGNGEVKVEKGEDPLLVKALAQNGKGRKKVKLEAVSKNVLQSDGPMEATGSGSKIKREQVVSTTKLESGEGQSQNTRKEERREGTKQGGKRGRGGKVGGKATARATNTVIEQQKSDNKVKGGPEGRGTQTNKKGKKSRSG